MKLAAIICFLIASSTCGLSQAVVTSDILTRVFWISYAGSTGTCFAIDVDDRQYLVTAKHVLPGIGTNGTVLLNYHQKWVEFPLQNVLSPRSDADVIVLVPRQKEPITTITCPQLRSDGNFLGQEAYFFGFPYGLHTSAPTNGSSGFPVPFVKKAMISGWTKTIWLDGHNNPGFSGGPVVVFDPANRKRTIIGVVSAYLGASSEIRHNGQLTPFVGSANTGLMVCYKIEDALEAIKSYPYHTVEKE